MDLKSVREQKRLTQKDLSDISGLSQSHIASIETGQLLPRKATCKRIERLLGSVIDWQKTLSADKPYVTDQIVEMLNLSADGALERVQHVKKVLHQIENEIIN